MRSLHRRDMLRFAGVVTAAGMAACLDETEPAASDDDATAGVEADDGDSDDEPDADDNDDEHASTELGSVPAYAAWIPDEEAFGADESVWFSYVDWAGLDDVDDRFDDDVQFDLDGDIDLDDERDLDHPDQLVALPLLGAFTVAFSTGLLVGMAGLGDLLDFGGDAGDEFGQDEPLDSTADETLIVGSTSVLIGSIDSDEISERLVEMDYTEDDEIDGYDVYTHPLFGISVAVADGSVLIPMDDERGREEIEIIAGTARGEISSLADTSERGEWSLRAGGNGEIAIGVYGDEIDAGADSPDVDDPEFDDDAFADATTIVSAMDYGPTAVTARLAAITDEANLDEDEIREEFGHTADERTIEIDDDRLLITGTWDAEE